MIILKFKNILHTNNQLNDWLLHDLNNNQLFAWNVIIRFYIIAQRTYLYVYLLLFENSALLPVLMPVYLLGNFQ